MQTLTDNFTENIYVECGADVQPIQVANGRYMMGKSSGKYCRIHYRRDTLVRSKTDKSYSKEFIGKLSKLRILVSESKNYYSNTDNFHVKVGEDSDTAISFYDYVTDLFTLINQGYTISPQGFVICNYIHSFIKRNKI